MNGNMSAGPIGMATLQAERFGVTEVRWKRSSPQY
ncbi:hypothetical protein ALP14_05022 [Pseudomonas amygdali pv. myricae]|nr:hypothetical protein ALP14_05022 [Pseudomonas amygdali pv. myricae]